jgi:Cys-rich four helix bundle protein (predicted Tat secretion target)
MNRRDLLLGASALAVAATASTASAADHHHDHMNHDHHVPGAGKYASLIKSAADCQVAGDECIAHCIVSMKSGDTTLADCLKSATEMMAVCPATSKLAAMDSASVKQMIAVCADICAACEKECRKHEKTHATCKACADACAKCVDECKKALKAA